MDEWRHIPWDTAASKRLLRGKENSEGTASRAFCGRRGRRLEKADTLKRRLGQRQRSNGGQATRQHWTFLIGNTTGNMKGI